MHAPTPLALPADARRQAVASLRAYVTKELELDLSDLQATLLLDHIVADIGPVLYNRAASDARAFIEERAADLEASLHRTEFPLSSRRKR